jgi:glycerophosphodiester phosphodiesterase
VDTFYNKKYAEVSRRLKLLHDRYGRLTQSSDGIDKDEFEELMGALLELRGTLRKLQWYGEVNRRGFVKITKKVDKKVANGSTQNRYLATKVDPKQFATNNRLSRDLKAVNDWMSALSEVKTFDDSASVSSVSSSLRRVATHQASLNLGPGLLDSVDQAIRSDYDELLAESLLDASIVDDRADPAYQKLLLNLLQRAISCKAKRSIERLLPQILSLEEEDDINKRNCIHRLVISIGRLKSASLESKLSSGSVHVPGDRLSNVIVPAEAPILVPPAPNDAEHEAKKLLSKNDESVKLLVFVLDHLESHQRAALQARDVYGRLPLHYAAQYGFVAICEVLIKHMQDWGQFDVSHGIDSPEWQDFEGYAPLHLAVMGGHPMAIKCLLQAENWQDAADDKLSTRQKSSKSGAVLALATKSNYRVIVKLLVEAGVDINYQDEDGETALHIAARFGHLECAKAIIDGSIYQKAELDIAEKTFGWTPVFIACVDGHLPIVELLIKSGADVDRVDTSGWSPKEHAALRGHINIAKRLAEVTQAPSSPNSETTAPSTSSASSSIDERRSTKEPRLVRTDPVKTFGHRYLTKETMVLVSLGSMDTRKQIKPVRLDEIPLTDAHATQLDTALSLVVSASGATGEPTVIDLPVQENISTEPISFMTMDVTKVKLLFDIVPTYAGNKDRVVGRAVAILNSIKSTVGSKRMNLQGDVSVPIVAANTLEVIGTVHFNFLVITPFTHPDLTITSNHMYWKSMASPMVIGHRGTLVPCFPLSLLTYIKDWARTWRLESLCSWEKIRFRYS